MMSMARALILMGVIFLVLGGLVYLLGRAGIIPGRLPGDIRWQNGNMTCILGLGTSLLLSIVLTIVVNIVLRLLNR